MLAIYNKISMNIDDLFYKALINVSNNVKTGLNFNNIFKQDNSPSGSLIDYNIRIIVYNCSTLGVIVQLAMIALGINLIVNSLCIGALLLIRHRAKTKLDGFLYKRAVKVALETVDFVNKATKLYQWVTVQPHQSAASKRIGLIAGKDFGPFGLFKTVSIMNELALNIRFEAELEEEEFNARMKNLPASTRLFLTLLKINASLQEESNFQPVMNIQELKVLPIVEVL